jgi:hypothetical protein
MTGKAPLGYKLGRYVKDESYKMSPELKTMLLRIQF